MKLPCTLYQSRVQDLDISAMEDIPRTPMLTVELKSSIPVDFQGVLKRVSFHHRRSYVVSLVVSSLQHILNQYGEDPDNYGDELAQLNQLREV